MLFQKRVVRTKCDIYVFSFYYIEYILQCQKVWNNCQIIIVYIYIYIMFSYKYQQVKS
jgi:hypothetical protein